MPSMAPRPLCLPELVSDPQTKADFIQANPPRYGPNSRPPSTCEGNSIPPSPSSAHGSDYYRRSRAASPPPPSIVSLTSTHTSLSIHNGSTHELSMIDSKRTSVFSQSSDKEKPSSKTWSISDIAFGDAIARPRATWSNTFKTKSWFGGVAAANEAKLTKPTHQIEIKLSPSMVAAVADSEAGRPLRPLSSPYPAGTAARLPRIGVGLQYYSEKNPAPSNIRKQAPDTIGGSEATTIPTLTSSISGRSIQFSHLDKSLPGIKISVGDT